MLDDVTAGDHVKGAHPGRNRREPGRVEAGLPALKIGVTSLCWCDLKFERCGRKTACREACQQGLIEGACAERLARLRMKRKHRVGENVEVTFRFAISDPGQSRDEGVYGRGVAQLDQPACFAFDDVDIHQRVGLGCLRKAIADRKPAERQPGCAKRALAQTTSRCGCLAHSKKMNSWSPV